MACPLCNEISETGEGISLCIEHEQVLEGSASLNPAAPITTKAYDVAIGELPTTLAIVVNEFLQEVNPFIKLHRLIDATEILTRFVVVVLLNDILRIHEEFPNNLRRSLAERIEKPTFGQWRELLEEANEIITKTDAGKECFVSELPAFIEQTLLPALGWGEGDVTRSVIALRNLLHHLGRLNDTQAQALLDEHQIGFQRLISHLAFWSRYTLTAVAEDSRVVLLNGLLPHEDSESMSGPPRQKSRELVPTHVFLSNEETSLDLFPLHIFDDVWQWREERPMRVSGQALQLFFRLSRKGYLEFTPLSHTAAFAQQRGAVLEKFRQEFPVSDWRALDQFETLNQDAMFAELVAELSEVFVGREDDIRHVKNSLKDHNRGVLWIPGKPGVGKSALMARLMRDFKDAVQHYVVIPYFFRIGHTGCSTEQFLKTAILKLQMALKVQLGVSPNLDERKEQFVSVVEEAATRLNRKILFLIDGMDEINRLEPTFISLPFAANMRNVVWLCAGRTEPPEIESALRRGGAHWVFAEGLPEMGKLTVRSMLTTHLEQMKYQLFARDQLNEGEYHNRFIDVLVHKSEGLPLYVRMVIEDLREGKWTLSDEDHLPDGLRAYFEQVLERLGVSSIGTILTPLFCLLAWAKEPITESALKVLLSSHYLSNEPDWEQHFDAALQYGHVMLRRVPTPEGEAGWMFYHDTFRQHLLESARVALDRRWAQNVWLSQGAQWRTVGEKSLRLYLLRNYSEHLGEAKRWEELFELARDAEFQKAQAEACPSEPELPLRLIRTALMGAAVIENASAIAEFMFAHARKLIEIIQEMPIDALRNGQLERAWEIADLHPTERSVVWYLILAAELKDTGRLGDAYETLERLAKNQLVRLSKEHAESALGLLTYLHDVNEPSFLAIQRQLLDHHDRYMLSESVLAEGSDAVALQVAETIESEWERFGALEKIAKAQARASQYSVAYQTADRINDEKIRNKLGVEIEFQIHSAVLASIQSRNFDGALELSKLKRSPDGQLLAFQQVAIGQAHAGIFDGAIATAQNVSPPLERDDLLVLIAETQARQGDIPAALNFSTRITTEAKKDFLKYRVSLQQIRHGDLTGALETLESIDDDQLREKGLYKIAFAYTQAGDLTSAFNMVSSIKGGIQQAITLSEIAYIQLEQNRFVAALSTAMQISVDEKRWQTLRTLAQIQAQRWNIDKKLIGGTSHEQYRKSIEILCTLALTHASQADTRAVIFNAATDLVQVFERINQRITALKIIVMAQTSTDDLVLARATLEKILNSLEASSAQPETMTALQQVANLQSQLGDMNGAQITLRKAAELINSSPNAAEMMHRLAIAYVQIGDTAAAIKKLAKAAELAALIINMERRESVLKVISRDQAYVGEFKSASITAERISNDNMRYDALDTVEKIQGQDPLFALQFLKLDSDLDKQYDAISLGDKTLGAIAKVQAEAGNLQAALYSLKRIKTNQEQITALRRVAKVMFNEGDVEALHLLLEEFADSTKLIGDHAQRSHCLLEIARMQQQFQNVENARSTLRSAAQAARLMAADELKKRDRRLKEIAVQQIKSDAQSDASETTLWIDGEEFKAPVAIERKCAEAIGLADRSRYDEAVALAKQIQDESKQKSTIREIAKRQTEENEKANSLIRSFESGDIEPRAHESAVNGQDSLPQSSLPAEGEEVVASLIEANTLAALGENGTLLLTPASNPIVTDVSQNGRERQTAAVSGDDQFDGPTRHPSMPPSTLAPEVNEPGQNVIQLGPAKFKRFFNLKTFLENQKIRSDTSLKESVRDQTLLNLIVAELQVGDVPGAQETVANISDSEMRGWALSEIVSHYVSERDFAAALQTAWNTNNLEQRANDIKSIADAEAEGLQFEAAENSLAMASDVAQGILDPEQRANILASIAAAQALIGSEAGRDTYAKALEAATRIENSRARIVTHLSIASSQVQTGLGEEARAIFATTSQTLHEISDTEERDPILLDWAVVQTEMEQFDKARYTIWEVKDEGLKGEGFLKLAVAQARAGEFDGAFKTVQLIPQKWRRVQALSAIAVNYARVNGLHTAQPIFEQAVETAKNLRDSSRQDETLQYIALAQVHAGEFEAALSTVQMISDLNIQVGGLEGIALWQAQSGNDRQARTTFSLALETARSISDDRQRSNVLRNLAVALSQAGLSDESVRTAETILVGRDKHITEVAVSLGEMSHREEFKRLLVSCSYSLESVHQVCGTLARLYPSQARDILGVILYQGE
jgi:hypothetical protein